MAALPVVALARVALRFGFVLLVAFSFLTAFAFTGFFAGASFLAFDSRFVSLPAIDQNRQPCRT